MDVVIYAWDPGQGPQGTSYGKVLCVAIIRHPRYPIRICTLQDQFLQLMDGVAKLYSSPQGLSAAIYTQVSDIEAEVNGESALHQHSPMPHASKCSVAIESDLM